MPGLVREVRIGGNGVALDAQLLEFRIDIGQIAQLGRADEGEVGWVEKDNGPLAFEVGVADRNELASVKSGGLEGFDFGVNVRHGGFS